MQYSIQDAICLEPRTRVIKTSSLLNRIQGKTNTICEPLSFMVFNPATDYSESALCDDSTSYSYIKMFGFEPAYIHTYIGAYEQGVCIHT